MTDEALVAAVVLAWFAVTLVYTILTDKPEKVPKNRLVRTLTMPFEFTLLIIMIVLGTIKGERK